MSSSAAVAPDSPATTLTRSSSSSGNAARHTSASPSRSHAATCPGRASRSTTRQPGSRDRSGSARLTALVEAQHLLTGDPAVIFG